MIKCEKWLFIIILTLSFGHVGCLRFYFKYHYKITQAKRVKELQERELQERMKVTWYDEVKAYCKQLAEKVYDRSPIEGVLWVGKPVEKDSISVWIVNYEPFKPFIIHSNIVVSKIVIECNGKLQIYDMKEWMKVIKGFEREFGSEDEFVKEVKAFLKREFSGGW